MSADVRPFEAYRGGRESGESVSLVTNARVIRGTAFVDPDEARTACPAGSRKRAGALRACATPAPTGALANGAKASEPCERGRSKYSGRGFVRAAAPGAAAVARLGGGPLRGF